MIVFNSMIVVVLALMIIYQAQLSNDKIERNCPIPWAYAIISMGYIVFWAALRSGFVDTRAYIGMFESMPTGIAEAFQILKSGSKDVGFDFLQIIFKTFISTDFHYWLAFIAIATGIPIAITFRRYSVNFLYTMFLFITSTTVIWMFNGIRQFLAAAILLYFSPFITERKVWKFVLVVFLCSQIHGTAWLMLPMYFFVTDKPFGKRMLLFLLGVMLCSVFIDRFMGSMETILAGTQYAQNLEQFAYDDGVNPLRVLFSCIPGAIALIKRKEIISLNNTYVNMCVNMSVVAAGIYFIGMFTSGIMIGRLPIYFSMFGYIILPYLFSTVYGRYKTILYVVVSIVYLIFYYLMAQKFYYISDILGNYA